MVGGPVWASTFDEIGTLQNPRQMNFSDFFRILKHNVEARISQLFDIWDANIWLNSNNHSSPVKVALGNGFLSHKEGTKRLHWSSKDDGRGLLRTWLEQDRTVTVGAITVNVRCSLTWTYCNDRLSAGLIELRTHAPYYRRDSKTMNIQISHRLWLAVLDRVHNDCELPQNLWASIRVLCFPYMLATAGGRY